ncbi:MAG: flagellar filament capping protein FliD [Limnochordales bacterium]|nr:flagellar filament capping protein FliD [Limnochordales bacterium]
MQIGGLISGLDTQALIDQLMQIEARPINIWRSQQDKLRTRKDAWRDVQSRLENLRSRIDSLLAANAFSARSVTVSEQSVVKATATPTATPASLDLNVLAVARSHRLAGLTVTDANAELKLQGSLQINGKTLTIESGDSLAEIRDKINGLADAGVRATLISNTLVLESTSTGSQSRIELGGDAEVLVGLGLTDEIDGLQASGITGTWAGAAGDELTISLSQARYLQQLTFTTSSDSGAFDYEVQYLPAGADPAKEESWMTAGSGTASAGQSVTLNLAKLTADQAVAQVRIRVKSLGNGQTSAVLSEVTLQAERNTLQAPRDAQVSVNGLLVTSSSNKLTNVSDGLTLELLSEGESRVSVNADLNPVIDRIKQFVEQYNSTYGFIQEKLAKDAALQGDGSLMRLAMDLRTRTTGPVAGTPAGELDQLALVGITTDNAGKLTVDESKLRAALETKPEQVEKLFTATREVDGREGVAVRLKNLLTVTLAASTGLIAQSQAALEDRIKDIDERIAAFERRLELRRQHLVEQFTALEKVLSTLSSQSTWLANQIKGLSSNAV